ncbi:MAG: homoserine kinase [Thermoprotei archaeon]
MRVISPSSSANLGSGYDVLAVAHDAFFDVLEIEARPSTEIDVAIESEGVPLDARKNSASYAVLRMLEELNIKQKVKIRLWKGVPAGLGLGSSGASAAGAVVGVNEALKLNLSKDELVKFASYGEEAAAGSAHPDNVAASVVGGFVAVVSQSPLKVVSIPHNVDVEFVLFIPEVRIEQKTMKARELVPKEIPTKKYVENLRFATALIVGLQKGDRDLIRLGLNDEIVEKAREPLFPYYPRLKEMALKHNAVGACVSGAGPSVLVFVDDKTDKDGLIKDGLNVCEAFGIRCKVKLARATHGARVEGSD